LRWKLENVRAADIRALVIALSLGFGGEDASAQELALFEIPFEDALALKPQIETFEAYANQRFDGTLVIEGARIGQVLQGQTLRQRVGRGRDMHWVLDKRQADLPLALERVAGAEVAAVVWDGAFGSQALAGLGPDPQPRGKMRLGTGIVTLLFDELQCMFGLRSWLDGWQDNNVMRRHPEGNLNLIFWNRNGQIIGDFRRFLDQGQVDLAYIQSSGGGPEIQAVTIQNLDPEGIGIDELVFSPLCPMIVSSLTRTEP
jgi:hypothetical protein